MSSNRPSSSEQPKTGKSGESMAESLTPLFRKSALLLGESHSEYTALLNKVLWTLRPRDFIEEIYAQDLVDQIWRIARLRRLEPRIIHSAHGRAIREILTSIGLSDDAIIAKANAWEGGDDDERQEILEELKEVYGQSEDDINARAYTLMISILQSLETILANIEARRNTTLYLLERRRKMKGTDQASHPINLSKDEYSDRAHEN